MTYSDSIPQPPPHSEESERVVLATILYTPKSMVKVSKLLRSELFYSTPHKILYEAIEKLYNEGTPYDDIVISQELQKQGNLQSVGIKYLMTLGEMSNVSTLPTHCLKLVEFYIRRVIIGFSSVHEVSAYDVQYDPFDLMDTIEDQIFDLRQMLRGMKGLKPISQSVTEVLKELEEASKAPDGLTGVTTGFNNINKDTGGFQKGDLIIVAGRPSMGKTAFALNVINSIAGYGKPVLIFSLEMSQNSLVTRMLSSKAKINTNQFRGKRLDDMDWDMLQKAGARLSDLPIHIDETPGASIRHIRDTARLLTMKEELGCIILDYLQLMPLPDRMDTRQGVDFNAKGLKTIAKELDVPVIVLSQLSRAVEAKPDKRPDLSHLKESGGIEEAADLVFLLYRPEYYFKFGTDLDEKYSEMTEDEYEKYAELILAKFRNGRTGTYIVNFIKQYNLFAENSDMSNRMINHINEDEDDDIPF